MKYSIIIILSVFIVACHTSSNTTTNTKPLNKGEEEFNAYFERKKSKFKNKAIPNFTVLGIDGKEYNPADMKGKIVLLNFWFTACKPCIIEIPSLNELQNKYKEQNVVVLSVSTDPQSVATATAEAKKINYLVGYNGKSFADKLEVTSYPTTFLIDTKGFIKEVFIGASSFDATQTYTEIKPHIEQLLQK